MAVLSGRWCLTFVFGQLRNLSFSIKSYTGHPGFTGSKHWAPNHGGGRKRKELPCLPCEQTFLSFLAFSKYFTNLFASLVSGEFEVTLFFVPGTYKEQTNYHATCKQHK